MESTDVVDKADIYLWVDQTCVDQTNIQERNHQVALMSRIYTQAASTITWLHKEYLTGKPAWVLDDTVVVDVSPPSPRKIWDRAWGPHGTLKDCL